MAGQGYPAPPECRGLGRTPPGVTKAPQPQKARGHLPADAARYARSLQRRQSPPSARPSPDRAPWPSRKESPQQTDRLRPSHPLASPQSQALPPAPHFGSPKPVHPSACTPPPHIPPQPASTPRPDLRSPRQLSENMKTTKQVHPQLQFARHNNSAVRVPPRPSWERGRGRGGPDEPRVRFHQIPSPATHPSNSPFALPNSATLFPPCRQGSTHRFPNVAPRCRAVKSSASCWRGRWR